MSKTLIFTITTGRSGSAFLTDFLDQNLLDARVYHERTSPATFGVDTPDASDLMQFNNFGVTEKIRTFWRRKFKRIIAEPGGVYAETAHQLAKAGLLENLDLLPAGVKVKIIDLQRDVHKTAWSLFNRREFENYGWTWLWWLDPRWVNKIVPSEQLMKYGAGGGCLWYVLEIRARAAYYRELTRDMPDCSMLATDASKLSQKESADKFLADLCLETKERLFIPERKNVTGKWRLSKEEIKYFERFISLVQADPEKLGQSFYSKGYRLGKGPARH